VQGTKSGGASILAHFRLSRLHRTNPSVDAGWHGIHLREGHEGAKTVGVGTEARIPHHRARQADGAGASSSLAIFGRCSRVCTVYFFFMRSRTSRIIATIILVTCIVCPLVDLFDNWDYAIQTGNETEYALVVLALCVGLAYSFARFVLTFPLFRLAGDLVCQVCASKLFPFDLCGSSFVSPIPLSPPTLALRI
jgi:hypothetical protein